MKLSLFILLYVITLPGLVRCNGDSGTQSRNDGPAGTSTSGETIDDDTDEEQIGSQPELISGSFLTINIIGGTDNSDPNIVIAGRIETLEGPVSSVELSKYSIEAEVINADDSVDQVVEIDSSATMLFTLTLVKAKLREQFVKLTVTDNTLNKTDTYKIALDILAGTKKIELTSDKTVILATNKSSESLTTSSYCDKNGVRTQVASEVVRFDPLERRSIFLGNPTTNCFLDVQANSGAGSGALFASYETTFKHVAWGPFTGSDATCLFAVQAQKNDLENKELHVFTIRDKQQAADILLTVTGNPCDESGQ